MIREDNPNYVLLLDEVEKAHQDIMSVMLALMDDGVITGLKQVKKLVVKTVLLMTSNLGAREGQTKSIGFGEEESRIVKQTSFSTAFFIPEFRNRLDGIVQFELKSRNDE